MQPHKKLPVFILAACLGLAGVVLLLSLTITGQRGQGALAQAESAYVQPFWAAQIITPTLSPTLTPTPAPSLYLPLMRVYKTPEVVLLNAWTSETLDGKLQAFLPGVPMLYQTNGLNNLSKPAKIGLNWQQSGPCSAGLVYSNTLSVIPGDWSHYYPGFAPLCTGVFTATVNMAYTDTGTTLAPRFVVNEPGTVRVNLQQGFDKCYHPDIDDMQVWWEKSPYVVFNLYIGGVSYACKNQDIDAVYVRQLAEQGWWFIPTWVGPQAPCSKYIHKMSSDRDEAYDQGKWEAIEAFAAAEKLGLFGEKVIYYDLESYTGDDKCRNTVKAFIRGWTEQLQALGSKAGAYGAACRSYISDWATNVPPPDDIWIAHWYLDSYDPDATVWNAVCLDPQDDPPVYWLHNQRIRQYAGGHSETWGKIPLTIDSNVLEGEVVFLPAAQATSAKVQYGVQVETIGPALRDLQVLDRGSGWLLADDSRLLWTDDGGESWRDIAPQDFSGGRILDAGFTNLETGWLVGLEGNKPAVLMSRTLDGGRTWLTEKLPLEPLEAAEVGNAYLETVDGSQVFVALKLQSGASFSRGRLFYSPDGGAHWEERALPLGEPVAFLDRQSGWTAGGPAGDQLFQTQDGGYTWQTQELDILPGGRVQIGLPSFNAAGEGYLPVVIFEDGDSRLTLYSSRDGGESWEIQENSHSQRSLSGLPVDRLQAGAPQATLEDLAYLPEDTIAVDIFDQSIAWAITQSGNCQTGVTNGAAAEMQCSQRWTLLRSPDSGLNWEEVTLEPDE